MRKKPIVLTIVATVSFPLIAGTLSGVIIDQEAKPFCCALKIGVESAIVIPPLYEAAYKSHLSVLTLIETNANQCSAGMEFTGLSENTTHHGYIAEYGAVIKIIYIPGSYMEQLLDYLKETTSVSQKI